MQDETIVFLHAGLEIETVIEAIAMLQNLATVGTVEGKNGPYPVITITEDANMSTMSGLSGYLVGNVGPVKFLVNPQTHDDGDAGMYWYLGGENALTYKIGAELVCLFGGRAYLRSWSTFNLSCYAHLPRPGFYDVSNDNNFVRMRNLLGSINPVRVPVTN